MTSARLTALRLVGFKSFAERTQIEFGPGISAVVGPNGSGKSNLADALRWTLGEQGRGLRTRRAEDVIFAGSSTRKAIGMADVTLVVDNHDRLLPVDYGEVEIGRRLYRSGENEYLLNRQKIRLRDLVELLDAGNLADNAFLFIGQGMVDQALALRPEERRPLFEEAAGVRRHERRRRRAESELAESEANLERLRDLLGELRPQARRLAAQAEQLVARRTAGLELAEALLASARGRWLGISETEARESTALEAAHAAADVALADLHRAEEAAATTSAQMAGHADEERARRAVVERHQAQVVELRVAQARLHSELAGVQREVQRIGAERAAVEDRLRDAWRVTSIPQPQPDAALAAELESIERALAAAGSDLPANASDAPGSSVAIELAALRNQQKSYAARAADGAASLASAQGQLVRLSERLTEAEALRDQATAELNAIVERQTTSQSLLDDARQRGNAATSAAAQTGERARQLETEQAALNASLAALDAALDATADEGLARAARARGGRLVAEGLEVDARFRNAVSAALDHAATGFVVDDVAPLLTGERQGTLVMRGGTNRRRNATAAGGGATVAAVQELGGGRLLEAVRRDPQAEVTRLLERVVWVPDIALALRLAPSLEPGWRVVTIAGDLLTDEGIVRLASQRGLLEQRAERDSLRRRATESATQLAAAATELAAHRGAAESASADARLAEQRLNDVRPERRTAEERERVAQRRAEQWLREVTWEKSQVERLATELSSADELVARTAAAIEALELRLGTEHASEPATAAFAAESAARLAQMRTRRDELVQHRTTEADRLAAWQENRRRAEIGRAIDESRVAELDRAHTPASGRQTELETESATAAERLAAVHLEHEAAAAELELTVAAGADDRRQLFDAERAATEARERLRIAEQQTRRSEIAQMEARLQLDQLREQLLVELAAIGADGLTALSAASGVPGVAPDDDAAATDAYEEGLERVLALWRAGQGETEPAPSPGRLSTLRRRYHDLGAGNPFAVQEYAELRERLETMEAQRRDLESAIEATRELIASLSALISDQFRHTFAALEDAFARRFQELFGGGDAQLSLTAPDDLSGTGVDIHARPPGKKRQPLSMLSGGERALTAVSLLLAMLEVRPVPFCVLDEVDAALDEANIGRFSKALRGLSEQTQFIVITHNRGTIEGADALYGVTLGDDAVSRVVSLRLPKSGANGDASRELVDEAEVALA